MAVVNQCPVSDLYKLLYQFLCNYRFLFWFFFVSSRLFYKFLPSPVGECIHWIPLRVNEYGNVCWFAYRFEDKTLHLIDDVCQTRQLLSINRWQWWWCRCWLHRYAHRTHIPILHALSQCILVKMVKIAKMMWQWKMCKRNHKRLTERIEWLGVCVCVRAKLFRTWPWWHY